MRTGRENINDVVDYNIGNSKNDSIDYGVNNDANNKNKGDFVPNQYFVRLKEGENIDELLLEKLLLEKFRELGIKEKDYRYFKLVETYCVTIHSPETLKELESLDYITLEPVGRVRALGPGD